ncbi:MAG: GNAT family N-acetyltransferase [Anaerolineales bacterium]|nr:GNAT family N-acetyltransferase [Anaerolineales bacterium]MCB0005847.1 GNAT family N-acetyltransferase [Anaerolineales bacterium]MCB0020746.1 GNAT family N-acetyltransferase [Anaerolineales bacterium]MCB0028279.1 GNAT family N-acetyltransferase [Anaerolineales bacterium]MCB8958695.1 GNAT family N-acetyltransferase [Ardenticatenales bacterium]
MEIALPTFTTERVRLRPYKPADLEPIAAIHADPLAMRFMGSGETYSHAQSAGYLKRHFANAANPEHVWAIALKESDLLIGRSGVLECDVAGTTEIEIGYLLAQEQWGKGYATEVARELVRIGFAELGYERLIAMTHPDNQGSIRVIEKSGFAFERLVELEKGPRLIFGQHAPTTA